MGQYGGGKARVPIMSDSLTGLETIAKVWRGTKNIYRRIQNGAVPEAITNVRETLGTVIFMWIPSNVGLVPNIIAEHSNEGTRKSPRRDDNRAAKQTSQQ
eukprot:6211411-Pleurochrysis_carterae.AAC.1